MPFDDIPKDDHIHIFLEDPDRKLRIKIGRHVKNSFSTILYFDVNAIIRQRFDCFDIPVHKLVSSQRIDFVGDLAAGRQIPIGHQFVAVKLDPCLHQSQLLAGQCTGENFALFDSNGCLKLGVLRMDVGEVVLCAVQQIQANDDPVKHRNDWHR
jgi:hypothetical protein